MLLSKRVCRHNLYKVYLSKVSAGRAFFMKPMKPQKWFYHFLENPIDREGTEKVGTWHRKQCLLKDVSGGNGR